MKKFILLLPFAFVLACTPKDGTVTPATVDYKPQITNLAKDVVLPIYADLYDKTELLVAAVATLQQSPTATNLELARQAWRNARDPWEQSEGFLFGPVDQQGIDPSIDSWPVNQSDLDAVLNSNAVLTKPYIDALGATLKGFHTIEYLLFGTNNDKQLADFTLRQFEYLKGCTESLNGATQQLYYAWKADKQNFINNLLTAGNQGNGYYPSQKAVLQEFTNGIITIADEVANGKIQDPFAQSNVTLEESRFSANSKADFANNIRSIRNAYSGTYKNTTGLGLSSVIAAKNSALDTKVKIQCNDAILAIENITGTFTFAVINARPSVENAQNKVRILQQTLQSEVLPLISNL